jgi:hypothetical protein
MGAIPKKIDIYLGLPNASEYTRHCLWRSSASLLLRLHVLKLSQRIKIVKRSRIQPHQIRKKRTDACACRACVLRCFRFLSSVPWDFWERIQHSCIGPVSSRLHFLFFSSHSGCWVSLFHFILFSYC